MKKKTITILAIILLALIIASCKQAYIPWPLPGIGNNDDPAVSYATLILDYGTGDISTEKIISGTTYIIPDSGSVENEGKVFVSWSDTSGNIYYVGNSIVITEDIKLTAIWSNDTANAVVNGVEYTDPGEAFEKAEDGAVIVLTKNSAGSALQTTSSPKNITIMLNGNTFTVDGTMAGSSGTKNQALQNLRGNSVTIKNGSMNITADGARMVFQNYGNLILDNVQVKITNPNIEILSINCGKVILRNGTILDGSACKVAADLFYWPTGGYPEGATLIIEDNESRIIGPFGYTNDYSYSYDDYYEELGKTQEDLYDDFIANTKVLIPIDYPYVLEITDDTYFTYKRVKDTDTQGYQRILPILK